MIKPGRTHILAVTLLVAIALAATNSVSEELGAQQPPPDTVAPVAPGTTDTTPATAGEPPTTTTLPEAAPTTIESTTTYPETTSTTQEPTTTTTAAETTTTAPEPTTTTPTTTIETTTTTLEHTTTTFEPTSTTLSPEMGGVVVDTQFMDLLAAAYANGKIDGGVYGNASALERGERLWVSVMLRKEPALTLELQALGAETTKKAKRKSLQAIRENVEKAQGRILPRLNDDEFIVRHKYALVNGFSGSVSKTGLKKLLSSEDVASIEAARPVYAMLSKSNPLINGSNPWFATKGNNGTGQAICVIDSGIDYTHPNIGGCSAPFSAGSCNKVPYGYDYVNSDGDPMDDFWHGTHVSGIIVSNSTTYRGIAPDARIIAMKVLDANGQGSSLDIDQAIDDCTTLMDTYNITVITISIGYGLSFSDRSDCTSAFFSTSAFIQTAYDAGIFIDVASGNSGYTTSLDYPACDPNVVSVGAVYDENLGRHPDVGTFSSAGCFDATTAPDNVTCYSNRANILDVWAPGSYITSTYEGGFGSADGTSMAAPHVAGAAALIQEYGMFRKYGEWLTPAQIKTALVNTGVNVTRNSVTKPRINAYAATRYYTNLAAPKLFNGSVTPTSGNTSANYTYRVLFTDRDDAAPAYVQVVIDGVTRNMTNGSSTWDSYVQYNYTTNLTAGNHTYYFTAYDGATYNTTANTSNSPSVTALAPPNVTLNSPGAGANYTSTDVAFNCSASGTAALANITLWGNWTGAWAANETKPVSGAANNSVYQKTIGNGTYMWNCRAADTGGQSALAAANRTFRVSTRETVPTWGVIHSIHTTISDGTMSQAQRAANLRSYYDFGATIEHDRQITAAEWTNMLAETAANNTDDGFTYFTGYEWKGVSSGSAEVSAFFTDAGPAVKVNGNESAYDTFLEYSGWLAANDGLGCVNHPSRNGNVVDWAGAGLMNATIYPCVEMLNKNYYHWNDYWNCTAGSGCVTYANPSPDPAGHTWTGGVQRALQAGYRLGFVGGWDYHGAYPGTPEAYTGLSGAYNWTREGVAETIRERHTWAAEDRIVMNVTVYNGTHTFRMGDAFPTGRENTTFSYNFTAASGKTIANISVFRGGVIVNHTTYSGQQSVSGSYTVNLTNATEEYVFFEAQESDGMRAWSSPMYVNTSVAPPSSYNCEGSQVQDEWNILQYTNCTDTEPLIQGYLNVTSGNTLNLTGTVLLLNTTRLTVDGTIILEESEIRFIA